MEKVEMSEKEREEKRMCKLWRLAFKLGIAAPLFLFILYCSNNH